MASSGNDGSGPIDLVPDDTEDSGQQVDAAMYIAAATLGSVVLPKGVSPAKAAFIEASGNFAQKLDTHGLTIGGFGGGPLGEKTREERRRQADAEGIDYLTAMVEINDERMERVREEWAQTEHSFAGTKMTGAEWSDLGDELKRGGALHDWLVTQMMRDGETRDQAEHKAADMADVHDALGKPPELRTQAERDAIAQAEHDPDYQRYTSRLAEMRTHDPATSATPDIERSTQTVSVDARDELFASAPDLTAHHQQALTATTQLDAPPPSSPVPPSPPASGAAGLEV